MWHGQTDPKEAKNKETKSKSKIGEPEKTDLLEEVSKWVICQSETGCCFHFLKKKKKKEKEEEDRNFWKIEAFSIASIFIYLFIFYFIIFAHGNHLNTV